MNYLLKSLYVIEAVFLVYLSLRPEPKCCHFFFYFKFPLAFDLFRPLTSLSDLSVAKTKVVYLKRLLSIVMIVKLFLTFQKSIFFLQRIKCDSIRYISTIRFDLCVCKSPTSCLVTSKIRQFSELVVDVAIQWTDVKNVIEILCLKQGY